MEGFFCHVSLLLPLFFFSYSPLISFSWNICLCPSACFIFFISSSTFAIMFVDIHILIFCLPQRLVYSLFR